jgi:16S rRNA (guanine966-N2)-methyltransferase
MRIIAGEAGGRRIRAPEGMDTRPAADRVREAVFSSIGGWVVGAHVLDLYAGSGSFGLEALSRGAEAATFVESSRKALSALESNIEAVGLGGTIVGDRVEDFLDECDQRFHLVFMDPPWPQDTGVMERQLVNLDRLLHPGAEVIVSRRHTDRVPEIPENWRVAANKRYGDTRILRYEKAESEDGTVQ